MRWLVVPGLFAAAITISSQPVFAQDKAQAIKRGEQVYAQQKCGTCHSTAGKGNKQGPLDGVGSELKKQ